MIPQDAVEAPAGASTASCGITRTQVHALPKTSTGTLDDAPLVLVVVDDKLLAQTQLPAPGTKYLSAGTVECRDIPPYLR